MGQQVMNATKIFSFDHISQDYLTYGIYYLRLTIFSDKSNVVVSHVQISCTEDGIWKTELDFKCVDRTAIGGVSSNFKIHIDFCNRSINYLVL